MLAWHQEQGNRVQDQLQQLQEGDIALMQLIFWVLLVPK